MSKQTLQKQTGTSILDVFQEFYYQYKKNRIYAFVLEVDETYAIQSYLISTEANIFDETEQKQQYLLEEDKWRFDRWRYRQKNNVNNISESISSLHQDNPISKIFEDVFPDQNRHEQLDALIESYQQSILFLTRIYNLNLNQILFLIYSPSQKNLATETAQRLNPSSSLLFEFLAQTRISKTNPQDQPIKLNQVDKDLLIDLAQLINCIEPYEPLTAAHQAYLLTLEPNFSNTHTHIQGLVQNIAEMSDPTLALDKSEILDRINYLYTV